MAKKIYVGNLPRAFSSSELDALFSPFGEVTSAEVIMDRMTGQSRGFGFVQMAADQAMREAMTALDGKEVDGRRLVVNEARDRPARGGSSGGGGGRFGGGGSSGGRSGGSSRRGGPRGYSREY